VQTRPAASSNGNAHAERFVRSIEEECLARIVPLGEWHPRRLVREFVAHYHAEGNRRVGPYPGVMIYARLCRVLGLSVLRSFRQDFSPRTIVRSFRFRR